MTEHASHLYLITPPRLDHLPAFGRALEAALDAGGPLVAALQIRLKDVSNDEIRAAARALMPIAHAHHVAVLMNDHVMLAKELGLDGVHLGQSDTPLRDARRILGPNAMIGVTCHNSRHLAMEAAENGADYVAFGAFYPTTTKTVEHMAELETLSIWQEVMEVPCVAIGGITADNAAEVVRAGADFLAVSAAVWNHPQGAAAGVDALKAAMDGALNAG
ncbi:thiamine phosphate synthase [Asticcacaulis sp. EMRT-3]|uniref:thiamine phosphate synthase n=1 Tax=Asticcacaulis sp. EMRT-3 TaxID=3040349 RepID=UPI0024AF8805|nr:thiamine phosphate synthase [Asticcacaulis sp. EMRT-3]MDI7773825.1 thiamine phosphate synthase [Asticcacaulis sp. EMRT-3]